MAPGMTQPEDQTGENIDQMLAKAGGALRDQNDAHISAYRAEWLTELLVATAFRGELVPCEADLARRKGRSYEPAAELLSRIQNGREPGTKSGRISVRRPDPA